MVADAATGGARAAVLRQRDERAAAVGDAGGRAVSEGRHQRPRRHRRADRQPRAERHEGGALVPAHASAPGETAELRLRLRSTAGGLDVGWDFDACWRARAARPTSSTPRSRPARDARTSATVMRQAFAGHALGQAVLPLRRRAAGSTAIPAARRRRPSARHGRNASWRHLNNHDVISMPDKWEYPWYAAWDLAFHCVALAHVDPDFAKDQLLLLCREWYMHPTASCPATSGRSATSTRRCTRWAALRVFRDRRRAATSTSSSAIFHKLLLNFTWWVNRKDAEGNNVFEGGFLGLDNIGPFDRSAPLPERRLARAVRRHGWMAMYCLEHARDRARARRARPAYEDVATKFFEHFALIAAAMNEQGLWDEEDGFYYDRAAHGRRHDACRCGSARSSASSRSAPSPSATPSVARAPARLRASASRGSCSTRPRATRRRCVTTARRDGRPADARDRRPTTACGACCAHARRRTSSSRRTGSAPCRRVPPRPPVRSAPGGIDAIVDYEPAESTTGLFGGNSNWRGPIWFPVNYLRHRGAARFDRYFGDDFTVEFPTGSGDRLTLARGRRRPRERLVVDLPPTTSDGRRPVFGGQRALPARPGVARRAAVPRVLPRRQRRRPRRLAPDRLDRPRRRPRSIRLSCGPGARHEPPLGRARRTAQRRRLRGVQQRRGRRRRSASSTPPATRAAHAASRRRATSGPGTSRGRATGSATATASTAPRRATRRSSCSTPTRGHRGRGRRGTPRLTRPRRPRLARRSSRAPSSRPRRSTGATTAARRRRSPTR